MNHFIDQQNQLKDLQSLFSKLKAEGGFLAVDTEFLREKTYNAKLCLLQLGIGEHQYCIDVLAIEDISAVLDLLLAENVVKIFHAARQDLEVLLQTYSLIPKPLFDTQLAAAFCGMNMQIGYGAMVEEELGVTLEKSQSRTNWLLRPLTSKQIEYAGEDVAYLEALYIKMVDHLKKNDRYQWYQDEIDLYYDPALYVIEPSLAYKRLAGGSLKRQQQYALKALAEWREKTAINRNIPRTWVLKDDALFDLAIQQPKTLEEVVELGVFGKKSVKYWGIEVIELINDVEVGDKRLWKKVEPLNKGQKEVCKKMMQELKKCSEKHEISQGLLATRKDVESLFRNKVSEKLLQGWRNDLVGKPLVSFLNS